MPDDPPCFIIAEAGVNHNGVIDDAIRLIDVAADAGADAVKFQTFKADEVATADAPKADYQTATTGHADSQLDMIRKLELGDDTFRALAAHTAARGIEFMSTPFDIGSLRFLADEIGVRRLKIPSGEVTNGPLLLAAAHTGLPAIMSTGMCSLDEIRTALGVLAFGYTDPETPPDGGAFADALASDAGQQALARRVVLLHCTTEYPAPLDDVNLRAMDSMASEFGLPVGYSDHTLGLTVPVAAAARGAVVIEKHITLDRTLPGPDQAASIEPGELRDLVRMVRDVTTALGVAEKTAAPSERKNITIARRSLVAARDIRRGEVIAADALTAKRPGGGLSPMAFWDVIGKIAPRDFRRNEPIEL